MTSRRRATVIEFFGGSAHVLLVAIQSIVLIPLYVVNIAPELYGAWLASGDIFFWMLAFDLGLANLLTQRIAAAHGRGDARTAGVWFGSGLAALAGIGALLTASGIGISFVLPGAFRLSGEPAFQLRSCFLAGTAATALSVMNNAVVGYSRGIQQSGFTNVTLATSVIASLIVSLYMILSDWGLYAIAGGLLTRAAVLLVGSIIFLLTRIPATIRSHISVSRGVLGEICRVIPATGIGGLGYAAMNQSELLLAGLLLGPQTSTILMVTRKGAEFARALADRLAFATFGPFAHLVASGEPGKLARVYSDLLWSRSTLATVLCSIYVALNPSWVAIWIGPEQYGGTTLTVLLGVQTFLCGGAYFLNLVYRATDRVVQGSLALFCEAVIRIAFAWHLVTLLGLSGIPAAGIVTGGFSYVILHMVNVRRVSREGNGPVRAPFHSWMALGGLGAVAVAASYRLVWSSVTGLAIAGVAFGLTGLWLLLWANPNMTMVREELEKALGKAVVRRVSG